MYQKEKDKILNEYYFEVSNAGSYSGPEKLFRALNKTYPNEFTKSYISKFLNNIDAYSLQKDVRHRFQTAPVVVTNIDEQFEGDLTSVANLAKENDNIRFLLFVEDAFSRFLWIEPLKDKTAESILRAIKKIFKKRRPLKFHTDKGETIYYLKWHVIACVCACACALVCVSLALMYLFFFVGSEFNNKLLKRYLKENDVYYFTTQNPAKSGLVERVQRTIKNYMYRMMRHRRNYRYIDDLQNIVDNYNATHHRSLNMAPKDVNKENEADVWAYMYLRKRKRIPKKKRSYKFNIGDLVRISYLKRPFQRSYDQKYTTEVFKVKNRLLKQGIPMYKLVDLNNEKIKGLFYNAELQKVDKGENTLWYIEKIIKKRKVKNKLQYYVKWEGYGPEFNSWVNAAEVKNKTSK